MSDSQGQIVSLDFGSKSFNASKFSKPKAEAQIHEFLAGGGDAERGEGGREQRGGINLKSLKDVDLQVKARIWP